MKAHKIHFFMNFVGYFFISYSMYVLRQVLQEKRNNHNTVYKMIDVLIYFSLTPLLLQITITLSVITPIDKGLSNKKILCNELFPYT